MGNTQVVIGSRDDIGAGLVAKIDGTDPTSGLYAVSALLEMYGVSAIVKQMEKHGEFVDESIHRVRIQLPFFTPSNTLLPTPIEGYLDGIVNVYQTNFGWSEQMVHDTLKLAVVVYPIPPDKYSNTAVPQTFESLINVQGQVPGRYIIQFIMLEGKIVSKKGNEQELVFERRQMGIFLDNNIKEYTFTAHQTDIGLPPIIAYTQMFLSI